MPLTRNKSRLLSFYTWLGALAVGWAALTTGCFSPTKPACAFSCQSETHACPVSYVCGADGICHRDDVEAGVCGLSPATDAGADAETGEDAASFQF